MWNTALGGVVGQLSFVPPVSPLLPTVKPQKPTPLSQICCRRYISCCPRCFLIHLQDAKKPYIAKHIKSPIKTKKDVFLLLRVIWEVEKASCRTSRIVCVEEKGGEEYLYPLTVFGALLCGTRCVQLPLFLCFNLSTRKKVHTHTDIRPQRIPWLGIKRKQTNQNIFLYIYIYINMNLIYNYLSIS